MKIFKDREYELEVGQEIFDVFGDIIDEYITLQEDGCNPLLVEATISELIGYGTMCGTRGNTCFNNIAEEFPDVKIRTVLIEDEKTASSSMIFLESEEQGERIAELAEEGGGKLRYESGTGWVYFETE